MVRVFHSTREGYDGTPTPWDMLVFTAEVRCKTLTEALAFTQHPMGGNWVNFSEVTSLSKSLAPRSTKPGDVLEKDGKFWMVTEATRSGVNMSGVNMVDLDPKYYAPLLEVIQYVEGDSNIEPEPQRAAGECSLMFDPEFL